MFKRLSLVCFILVFGITAYTYAQDIDAEIPNIGLAPVIDGQLEDVWSFTPANKIEKQVTAASSEADCSGTWRSIWDSEYFYIFFEIKDDALSGDSTTLGDRYNDDSVEVFIDIGNTDASAWAANDFQYRFSYDPSNRAVGFIGADHAANLLTGIVAAWAYNSTGYCVEAKIPWTTLNATAEIDQIMGFDVQINDDDNGGGRDSQLCWYTTQNNAYNTPSAYGTVSLVVGKTNVAIGPISPINKTTDVDTTNAILSWISGRYVNTHNLFIGTDFNDVNNATIDNHPDVTVTQGIGKDITSYNPGNLEMETTYYWRVDEVNAPPNTDVIYKGTVWSFRTEDIALKVPASDIVATAKNSSSKNDPNNVINELGLDPNTDQHSTGTGNWQSSTANSASDPLWIRFDFRRSYKLHQMFVWNMNNKPVAKYGFQKVRIEYLKQNDEWAVLTTETTFAIGSGTSDYVYNTTVEFNDVVAKAVRLTMISNWDNKVDKGYLSEIRFTCIPTYARLPLPDTDVNNISVDSVLSWRKGREALSHSVYIDTNENAVANGTAAAHSASTSSYTPSLNLGRVYYWRVDEINNSTTPSKWSGDVWSFSTEEYITMEDFEDYNDFIGSLIFETWIGGDSDSTLGGSQVGHTDAPFAEETIFQSGKKSGPIYYNNTSANTSIGERSFEDTLNLTSNGADTLRLFYRGKAVTFQAAKDGSIAMSAEGSDIQGTADQFRFAYKTLTSSTGSITVRVDSIENANAWSKAGIMIRNSLEPNDVHVTAVLAANNTAEMESRSTKGGTTTAADVTNLGNPCWLKISRSGNDFTVQRSKDGTNWYSFGTDPNVPSKVTITMGSTVYIGLVVTSHTADVLAAATFYNASTTGSVSGSTWTVAPIGDIEQAEGGNTLDALYVYLTDSTDKVSAKVYAPLLSAVGSGSWMKWEIPTSYFTNVNLTKIKKISIGVGDTATPLKGKGTIFIDNIGYGHTLAK